MNQALYAYALYLSCMELGYEHEAAIYLEDSWLFLLEEAAGM